MADPKRSAAPKSTGKGGKKKTNPWVRALIWVVSILLSLGIIGVGAIAVAYSMIKLPDPNADFQTNTTFIYYRDGEEKLGSLAVQNRQTISYAEMPQLMKDAVVAAENRTFWEDPGFSVTGIARGAFSIATGGELTSIAHGLALIGQEANLAEWAA